MNERIRELQSKSYLMCKQIVDDDGHVVVTPDKWFDNFAELLIRECADYIQHFYGDIAASSIGNDIKLHFGIEE